MVYSPVKNLITSVQAHQRSMVRSTYGDDGFDFLKDLPVLCSGVTIDCPLYLLTSIFCAEISRHAVERRSVLIPIWDQAYHNIFCGRILLLI